MKKLIIIIVVLLLMGCGSLSHVKVLEVKSVEGKFIVIYSENIFTDGRHNIYSTEFNTMTGVENFIYEVADEDFSKWLTQ